MNQSKMPTNKVNAYTVGAAIAALIAGALASYGIPITPDLTVAIAVLVGFAIAYMMPERSEFPERSDGHSRR